MYSYTLTADGYTLEKDGVTVVNQAWKGGVDGYKPFGPGEAEASAQAECDRLNAPPPAEEPAA